MCLHSPCALFALCLIGVMSACFNSISVVKLLGSSSQCGKSTKGNWEKMFFGCVCVCVCAQIKETLMQTSILKIKSSSQMPSLIHIDYLAVRNVFARA